jgi:hypothetical protein
MKQRAQKPLPTDRVAFTVRIPRALRDQLKATSLREQTSVQALAEQRLRSTPKQSKAYDSSWLLDFQVKGPGKEHYSRADYYEA